jgi:cation:H+ antiporter
VFLSIVLLLSGLLLLTLSADRFVLAAARLSRAWGLSPVLIGALVVGLGTSAPELLVSVLGASRGELDIAVGNVVGSNVSNVTLVLGAAALVAPIASRVTTIRREGALMFVSVAVLAAVLWDLQIGRLEGFMLLACMACSAWLLARWARREDTGASRAEEQMDYRTWVSTPRELIFGIGSLGLTLLGADLLVRGASRLADDLGITAAFVGLVIVSVGTSLPELATALAAARRGETDLVLGNIVGSNLFNSLMVTGSAALVGPGRVSDSFGPAMLFMVGSAAVAGVFAITGRALVRWEGAVLAAVFLSFVAVAA